MIRATLIFCGLCWPVLPLAQVLDLPGNAKPTAERADGLSQFNLPTNIWANSLPHLPIEGNVSRQAWQIAAGGLTTLQIMRPLREQLRNAGFDVVFECATQDCGGFDFRFALDILPPPAMQVNLADFRYLSALQTNEDGDILAIGIMVSRTPTAGYVHITQVGAEEAVATTNGTALGATETTLVPGSLADQLEQRGKAVLSTLQFERGSAQLSEGPFPILTDLAAFLDENPELTVALVGHTDSEGSLDGNIALSKRRAGSVLERLVRDYNVPRRQLAAEGMGYLSPVANNLTPEGREANRRVEVIITSTGP